MTVTGSNALTTSPLLIIGRRIFWNRIEEIIHIWWFHTYICLSTSLHFFNIDILIFLSLIHDLYFARIGGLRSIQYSGWRLCSVSIYWHNDRVEVRKKILFSNWKKTRSWWNQQHWNDNICANYREKLEPQRNLDLENIFGGILSWLWLFHFMSC